MTAAALLSELGTKGVRVSLAGSDLQVQAPAGCLTEAVAQLIKAHKPLLVRHLQWHNAANPQPVEEQEYYGLSHAQLRVWILHQQPGTRLNYQILESYRLRGALDVEFLQTAFGAVCARYEALRTTFAEVDGVPVQRVGNAPAGKMDVYKVPAGNQQDALVRAVLAGATEKELDLRQGPLLRAGLIRLNERDAILFFIFHHIIFDRWSLEVFLSQLIETYGGLTRGETPAVRPERLQYRDYAAWENAVIAGPTGQVNRAFWKKTLSESLTEVLLPRDRVATPLPAKGAPLHYRADEQTLQRIKSLCGESGVTLFTFVLSVVKILIYRYTDQRDITVGTPFANRTSEALRDQIGFFVNSLPIRTRLESEWTFRQTLREVGGNALDAFAHQPFPFDWMVQERNPSNPRAGAPLYNVEVILQNQGRATAAELNVAGLSLGAYDFEVDESKFDWTFSFEELDGQLHLQLEYDAGRFSSTRMEKVVSHFGRLLADALDKPFARISALNLLEEQERLDVIQRVNRTQRPLPEKTIIDLFEEAVARTPDRIALVEEDISLTYACLNGRANQLGHLLREQYGVKRNDLVGLHMSKSHRLVIGVLGILKAGAAYLPVDPTYPLARRQYMVEESNLPVLLVDAEPEKELGVQTVCVTDTGFDAHPGTNPGVQAALSDLAYGLYTSGSTGKPKGVLIEQGAVLNLTCWLGELIYRPEPTLIALLNAPVSFDASVQQLFAPLCFGGRILVIPERVKQNPAAYVKAMVRQGVSVLDVTPSHLGMLLDVDGPARLPECLRFVIVAGERLEETLLQKFFVQFAGSPVTLVHAYGVTECTVNSTFEVVTENSVSIGLPLPNNQVYILDGQGNALPAGWDGEICIGGMGLARGYLNDPEKTHRAFVKNPFRPGELLYRSGDYGRLAPGGKFWFKGRKDHQVKINGYRVDLLEVTAALKACPGVGDCRVSLLEDKSRGNYLVAWVTGQAPGTEQEVLDYLGGRLARFMIPQRIIFTPAFPLNENGKIDEASLKQLAGDPPATPPAGRPSAFERQLLNIWEELLGKKNLLATDNFFEVGGDSLKAARLSLRIQRELGLKVGLRDIFNHPTATKLGAVLRAESAPPYETIPPVEEQDRYRTSHSQRRIWMLHQIEAQRPAYSMPELLALNGNLDRRALNRAFQRLLQRHEMLRTSFHNIDFEVWQKVSPAGACTFEIEWEDVRQLPPEAVEAAVQQEAARDFDLRQAPLVRAKIFRTRDAQFLFFFNIHHILFDEWSSRVFISDLQKLISQEMGEGEADLPPFAVQYKDYAAWQNQKLQNGDFEVHGRYWREKFATLPPRLALPLDFKRPPTASVRGKAVSRLLREWEVKPLVTLARFYDLSLFMMLAASVKVLLYKYTRQSPVAIGFPIANRDHESLKDQIGLYLNTVALATRIEEEQTFEEVLLNVRNNAMEAFEHQAYPFDLVVAGATARPGSNTPLFDVLVDLTKLVDYREDMQRRELRLEFPQLPATVSHFDLVFNFVDADPELSIEITYNTDIFRPETIMLMRNRWVDVVGQLVDNPRVRIADVRFSEVLQPASQLIDLQNDF